MAKGVEDSAVEDAKNVLGFEGKQVTYADLRRSYKALARKFHPDKNPNGRQMFEKIRIAYELLSSVDMEVTETDLDNVALLIKAQNIIYRRFPDAVNDQKYPAFQHLLDVLAVPLQSASGTVESESEEASDAADAQPSPLDGTHADLLLAGTTLIFYTCSVSPLNVREFVKVGGTKKLFDIVLLASRTLTAASQSAPSVTTAASKVAHELLLYALKAFTSIAAFDVGRSCILTLCPLFAETMCTLLLYDKVIPVPVESCIETISRCCELADLQKAFECSGLVWRLVPMLLAYDGTLEEDYADESLRLVHCQNSSNMFLDLASPPNPPVVETLNLLLTQPIAKLLRNRRPWDLLSALNQNVERTTMIWNLSMRRQLLEFVLRVDRDRNPGSHEGDLLPAETSNFSALDGELCVCGVYLRIFNRTAVTVDIDDPSLFAKDLLDCIRTLLLTPHKGQLSHSGTGLGTVTEGAESERSSQSIFASVEEESCFRECNSGVEEWGLDPSESEHYRLQLSVDALRTLSDVHSYIAFDIATHVDGPDTVFLLLDLPSTCPAFLAATQLLTTLGRSADFVSLAMKNRAGQPSCLWRLLRAACTTLGPGSSFLWSAAEGYSSHVEGLRCLLDSGHTSRHASSHLFLRPVSPSALLLLLRVVYVCSYILLLSPLSPNVTRNSAASLFDHLPILSSSLNLPNLS
jgi:DnaJ domain